MSAGLEILVITELTKMEVSYTTDSSRLVSSSAIPYSSNVRHYLSSTSISDLLTFFVKGGLVLVLSHVLPKKKPSL